MLTGPVIWLKKPWAKRWICLRTNGTQKDSLLGPSGILSAFNHASSVVIKTAMTRQGVPIAVIDWNCHILGNRNCNMVNYNNIFLSRPTMTGSRPNHPFFIKLWIAKDSQIFFYFIFWPFLFFFVLLSPAWKAPPRRSLCYHRTSEGFTGKL